MKRIIKILILLILVFCVSSCVLFFALFYTEKGRNFLNETRVYFFTDQEVIYDTIVEEKIVVVEKEINSTQLSGKELFDTIPHADTLTFEIPVDTAIFEEQEYIAEDSIIFEDAEFTIYEDGSFAYEEEDMFEGEILVEQMVKERLVEVLAKNELMEDLEIAPEEMISHFNVQKWKTPFKNRKRFYRNQTILKLEGIEIEDISIYYINNNYYLHDQGNLFILLNNKGLDPLIEIKQAEL